MIVQCPYCATRYEVETARLNAPNPMLKCSRCHHIFPAPSSKKQPAAASTARSAEAPERNLTLPFERATWKDEAPPTSADDLNVPDADDEGFTLGTEEPPAELNLPHEPPEPETPVTPEATVFDEEDEVDVEREPQESIGRDEEEPEQPAARRRTAQTRSRRTARRSQPESERGKMWALFIFMAAVVGAYGMLTRALFASPALCDKLVGRLPLIGTLADERLLTRKVALSDVVGNYQRIKEGKEVFVITGKALNTAPLALHSVQLLGKLYSPGGEVLEQKTIYCGNVISAKVLKDLTQQEVSILQKLNPPKRFMIEPGESSTFVIVFMDPPRGAVEFSAQVVAAQRQA